MGSISAIELARKMLRVDMTTGKLTTELIDESMVREYLGGSALAAKILYDEVKPEVQPLDPENLLIITTGIATGTTAPATALYNVMTKVPLTNLAGSSQSNGFFGMRLKQAGYSGIIIQGQSPTWKYLVINNGQAELRDAQNLLGKTTFETETMLKEEAGTKKAGVACIGVAGEKLVRFAAIENDFGHFASSGGPGCVMGSKKLKAILVYGDYKIEPVQPEQFKEAVKNLSKKIAQSPPGKGLSALGTGMLIPVAHKLGYLPIKNLSHYDFPEFEKYDAAVMKKNPAFEFKKTPCYACPIGHCREMTFKEGPYAGKTIDEPEYEGWQAFSGLIGVTDIAESAMLNTLNDELAMDLKELRYTLGWAIECYEKGYITKEDTDGLELTWGNVDAIRTLMKKIANREGFGNLLAEGVYRASHKIGGKAIDCAVYTKRGQAPHIHDPRGNWSVLFIQGVTDGSDMFGGFDRGPAPDLGYDTPIPLRESKAHPIILGRGVRKNQFNDSFMTCYFCFMSIADSLSVLNPLTGWDMTEEEALNIGERTAAILRSYNLRNGATAADDSLSTRLMNAPVDGPAADGPAIGPVFEEMKHAYYKELGWNEETSVPLPETLKKLDLDFIIKDLYNK